MKKYSDEILIKFILEFCDDLDTHLQGYNSNNFHNNITVKEAVFRTLHKISETCMRLNEETKNAMPEIEWREISSFRNFIVHEYLGDVNYNIIGEIIELQIPKLKSTLKKYYGSKF